MLLILVLLACTRTGAALIDAQTAVCPAVVPKRIYKWRTDVGRRKQLFDWSNLIGPDSVLQLRGAWYVGRQSQSVDKLVRRADGKCNLRYHVLRGRSGFWYYFNKTAMQPQFASYVARLPIVYDHSGSRFWFNGTSWYITLKNGTPSRVVSQSYKAGRQLEAETEDGVWHKVPNIAKMGALIRYLSTLPKVNSSKRYAISDVFRLRRIAALDQVYYALKDEQGVMRRVVARGDCVLYARGSNTKWYRFKSPPLAFIRALIQIFYSRIIYDKSFNIDDEGL